MGQSTQDYCNCCTCGDDDDRMTAKFVIYCIVAKIKKESGVSIRIPSDDNSDGVVRIEGTPEGVASAKQQLIEMVEKMVCVTH